MTKRLETITAHAHVKNISDSLFQKYDLTLSLLRTNQVAVTRRRIGHAKIAYFYLSLKDLCEDCYVPVTGENLILSYPKYNTRRMKQKLNPCTKDNVKKNNIHKLLRFIKEIKIIDGIL